MCEATIKFLAISELPILVGRRRRSTLSLKETHMLAILLALIVTSGQSDQLPELKPPVDTLAMRAARMGLAEIYKARMSNHLRRLDLIDRTERAMSMPVPQLPSFPGYTPAPVDNEARRIAAVKEATENRVRSKMMMRQWLLKLKIATQKDGDEVWPESLRIK
jgi:hypothetical protein